MAQRAAEEARRRVAQPCYRPEERGGMGGDGGSRGLGGLLHGYSKFRSLVLLAITYSTYTGNRNY